MITVDEFLEQIPDHTKSHPQLREFFIYATEKHAGQVKLPKEEPYINHVIRVTLLLRSYDLDLIIAALLHDIVEKTETSLLEIEELAGQTVATLVRGVTKTEQNQDIIRLLLATVDQDRRAVVLRLADRLDNLRYSYPHMTQARREKYRRETPRLIRLAQDYGISDFVPEIQLLLEL